MKSVYSHHETCLDNGLRVITVELPHLHTAVISCYVKTGSRYEDTHTNGLSHYLEHMLFRGAGPYKDSTSLVDAIESTGIELSALTMRDCCIYEYRIQPDQLKPALKLLAMILQYPRFQGQGVEKQIIIQEIMDDMDEHGDQIDLDNLGKAHIWQDHPLGLTIAGTIENVKSFSQADLETHHRKFYNASNMILCVAGPLLHAHVEEYAAQTFGGLRRGSMVKASSPLDSSLDAAFLFAPQRGSYKTQLQLNFKGFSLNDPDILGLELVHRLLDDGMSARLHKRICDELGLAYDISASIETYADTGLFMVDTSASHDRIPSLIHEIFEVIRELKVRGVGNSELQRVKRRYCWELDSCLDSVEAMASWYGGARLFYNPDTIEQRMTRVLEYDINDVLGVCDRVFRAEALTVISVGGLTEIQLKQARSEVEHIDWGKSIRKTGNA